MSRKIISAATLRQLAAQCYSWKEAAEKHQQIRTLYGPNTPQFQKLNRRLSLNDFDRSKVAEELLDIATHPNKIEADVSRRNWFQRLLKTRYPFNSYHYMISYEISEDRRVTVNDILFDKELLGPNTRQPQLERNALYRVDKTGTRRFTGNLSQLGETSDEVVKSLRESWQTARPTPAHRVETRYAAANA